MTLTDAETEFHGAFDLIEAGTLFDVEAELRMAGETEAVVAAVLKRARRELRAMRLEKWTGLRARLIAKLETGAA